MRKLSTALLIAVSALPAAAQNTERMTTLKLDEAISLATQYNPSYLQAVNNRKNATLGIRQAYAAFFPTVGSSLGFGWREGIPTIIEGQQFGSAVDQLSSQYGLSVGVGFSYDRFLQPSFARAQLDQADFSMSAQSQTVRRDVSNQYWTAVQAARSADLQDSLVSGQRLQFELARAKEAIGSGISLDTKNAEVSLRQQELAAARAHNDAEIQVIRLFEIIGVAGPRTVQLTTDMPIAEPTFTVEQLLADAKQHSATLAASRAGLTVADVSRKQAKTQYIPSLNLSTGIGGNTSMATDAKGDARTWPFSFQRNPINFSVGFSLPIWNGFARENAVDNANIRYSNAQQQLRQTELTLNTSVASSLSQLQADFRSYQLQLQIVDAAQQAFMLAQEKYRIGSTPYTDLSLALDRVQREQNQLLVDKYTYQRTFAQLEAAVGRPLR